MSSDDMRTAVDRFVRTAQRMPLIVKLSSLVSAFATEDIEQANKVIDSASEDELAQIASICELAATHCRGAIDGGRLRRKPEYWQQSKDIGAVVVEPDGWHNPPGHLKPKRWSEPITKEEYIERLNASVTASKGTPAAKRAYDPKHGGDEAA
jgi:hypothetical protein